MTEQQVLFKLTALCSGSEHCSYEMTEKMRKWEVDEPTQARIMEYLVREKYVDDERYARYFVADKIRFNKWGRKKIEMALFAKRIPKEIITAVLNDVDASDYQQELRTLIQQKAKTVKAKTEYEKSQKLIRFALGRGYTFDVIKEVLSADFSDETVDFDE